MTKKKKKGLQQCIYCGKNRICTKDHIPPKSLFPDNQRKDLITVPACSKCHKLTTKDDELFKIAIHEGTFSLPRSQPDTVRDSIIRGLQRPASRGLRESIIGSLGRGSVITEAGIILGEIETGTYEYKRIRNVSNRIIRGLYFHVFRKRIPDEYIVHSIVSQPTPPKDLIDIMANLKFAPFENKGDGVFEYTYAKLGKEEHSTFWLMLFNIGISIVGWTRPPDVNRNRAEPKIASPLT